MRDEVEDSNAEENVIFNNKIKQRRTKTTPKGKNKQAEDWSTVKHETHMTLDQRFSIPVLAPPRSAHFVCYSYHFRRLFYSNASALRSGHHTIFLHDSSSKRTYSIHSAFKCARHEFKLCIFTDVYNVTLVCA